MRQSAYIHASASILMTNLASRLDKQVARDGSWTRLARQHRPGRKSLALPSDLGRVTAR